MTSLLDIIELLGTLAFAYGGIVEARRNNLDLVGAFTAAFLSAFGGGTLRDVLLDRRPLYWVAHPSYPLLVFVLTVVVQVAFRGRLPGLGGTWWLITDALGLGLFSAAGVSIAVEQGLPLFPASLFGVITATFGGVLRDVICAQVPEILSGDNCMPPARLRVRGCLFCCRRFCQARHPSSPASPSRPGCGWQQFGLI